MDTPCCIKSALFVPGDKPDRIDKALAGQASAVIIDLEDAVTPDKKGQARQTVREKAEKKPGKPVIVRVNALDSQLILEDISTICRIGVFAIMIPKLTGRNELIEVNRLILKAEKENDISLGSIKIIPLVENALAVENAYQIASTRTDFDRLFTLAFGAADFSLDMGVVMTREGLERQYPRARLALACRAAGLEPPLDSPYMVDLKDLEGLEKDTWIAKNLGFGGKMCVHPTQIEIINRIFSYGQDEIVQAQKIIDAFKKAESEGKGAIQLDGKFIDIALVRNAQRILAASESGSDKDRS